MEKRNRYTSEFKVKVVLELLREEGTLNQIAGKYELNPQMLSQWKREFLDRATDIFDQKKGQEAKLKKEMAEKEANYQKIVGQMSYEISWLKKKSGLQ
jgi:transposase-like protein